MSWVGELFGERKGPVPAGFADVSATGPDAPDMLSVPQVPEIGDLTGTRLAIVYCDGSGEVTRRVIRPMRVFRGDPSTFYVQAFCELRGAVRTFRVDRVREVIDCRTGEVFENPQKLLLPLLVASRAGVPAAKNSPAVKLLAAGEHALTVLIYFAHEDQRMARTEMSILWRYLEWQAARSEIKGYVSRRPLNAWMKALYPTTLQFAAAVEKLSKGSEDHASFVLSLIPEIVLVDGTATPEEKVRLRTFLDLATKQWGIRAS